LIGGLGGGDTLTSGGADILIAGFTNYDTNIAALQTILAEWKTSTPSTYFNVISTIESGVVRRSAKYFNGDRFGSARLGRHFKMAAAKCRRIGSSPTKTGGTNPNDALFGVGMADTITEI